MKSKSRLEPGRTLLECALEHPNGDYICAVISQRDGDGNPIRIESGVRSSIVEFGVMMQTLIKQVLLLHELEVRPAILEFLVITATAAYDEANQEGAAF